MLQARITPWIATVVVLPLIVLGAGSQNLLWAFQIGFLGSVALGLGTLLLVNHAGTWERRDWAGVALAVFALLWSGVSVLLIVVCTLVVLLRRGIKPASAFALVPGVVYIVWAVAYPPPTNLAAPSVSAFADLVWSFVATGLSTAADAFVLDAPLLGSVGLLLLAIYLVRTAERATTQVAAVYACAAGAGAQYVLSAYGRWELGVGQATETRYGYITIVLLAPAIAMVADRLLAGRSTVTRVGLVVVVLLVAASNARLLRDAASVEAARELPIRNSILAAAQIANDPTQKLVPDARPEPQYSPDLTVADLRRFGANGELPSLRPSPADQLTAAANLQIGLAKGEAVAACAAPPIAQTTLLHTGPDGVQATLYGTPDAVVSVILVDPATGASGVQSQFTLPGEWSRLTVYRRGVDVKIITAPNSHVCPGAAGSSS